ncbi:hypothetical protein [Larkinella terrae]|uniref:Uncharacterized protein n=1 Tax=Larkinella terrae TaxID=2025311 RepID=A0A7K0EJ84_9BACT|nr:hypothetical protein [Larkinella terrae]MRS61854.1 hypothetical protein [Larkinella terrae]
MKRILSILCVLVVGMLDACQNPLENFELKFKDPLAVAVQIKYTIPTGLSLDKLTIKVAGPDAEKVVTTLNTRKFKLTSDGKLFLCLQPSVTPSATAPLRFNVVALSPESVDHIQEIKLENSNQRNLTITLVSNKNNAEPAHESFKGTESGTVQNTATVKTKAEPSVSQATVTVPQGSEVKDVAGQPVGGALTVTADPVDNSNTSRAVSELPGHGIINASTSEGGFLGNQQVLSVAGGVRITVYNDEYQLAKTFSKPIQIAFAIKPQMMNPNAGRLVQAGDQIPLFSFDEITNKWTREEAGKVQRNASGELEYVAEIKHLSLWVAAFTEEVCDQGPTFKFVSNYADRSPGYRCEVIDQAGNLVIRAGETISFTGTINNGSSTRITNLKKGLKIRLRLYDNNDNNKVYLSPEIDGCSNTEVPFDLKSVVYKPVAPAAPDKRQNVTITLNFKCGSKGINPDKLPFKVLYAQFRAAGSQDEWKDLPTLRWPALSTTVFVELNKVYDLRWGSIPDRLDIEIKDYKVTSTSWPIDLTESESKQYCNP